MFDIGLPHIDCVEDSADPSYGKFVMAPLFPGHGSVIGNSMRRILLSSMPGTAITSIKINGVPHEFSTIPGVKEDVTEIVLNVKGIIAKLYCDEPRTVHIEAVGEGPVTASDIKVDGEVEILNPDHHIATLGQDAALIMELTFAHGRGYVLAKQNRPSVPIIGTIPVDSSYNPMLKVNYTVENIHVGDDIAYDRLTLEVWTNGVITARDAVSLSGRILCDHFSLIANPSLSAKQEGSAWKSESKDTDILELSIDNLNFSVRSYNCLKRGNVNTVGDLVSKTEYELSRLRNMGQKSLEEVKEKLISMGLSLTPDEEIFS